VAITRTLVVAGAGIGALTASLTLAAKGFRVIVLEKAERLEEAGAGLQLSPNASRILVELGLAPRLSARAVTPEAIAIMSARAGGEISRLPLGEAANFRAGSPYWVMHRADCRPRCGPRSTSIPTSTCACCQFEDVPGTGLTVVARRGICASRSSRWRWIGADGIWSSVRTICFGRAAISPAVAGGR
jgi:salicylate hydroxylase